MSEVHLEQRAKISEEKSFVEQIDAAINAHGEWKIRLARGIETGCTEFDPEKIRQDNLCVLGKWLYSDGITPYKGDLYEAVRKKHAEFHEATASIVAICREGQTNLAKRELKNPNSPFNQKTRDLVRLLNEWKLSFLAQEEKEKSQAKNQTSEKKPVRFYFFWGSFFFGFFFIFLGWLLTCYQYSLPLQFGSFLKIYELAWPNYIIALAPIVLGPFGYFIGRYIDKNIRLNEEKRIIEYQKKQIEEFMKDNQILLDNMIAGILLFDQNFKVRLFSTSATNILMNTELKGRNLEDLFVGLVDEKKIGDIKNYAELMKNPNYSEEMLEMLNPLDNLYFPPTKNIEEKFIRAYTQRIYEERGDISGFILVLQDVTKEVQAERKAEAERKKADKTARYLDTLLNMEPLSVLSFELSVKKDIEEINQIMREAKAEEYKKILPQIYRIVHTIKGTSALFGFSLLADLAHDYEEAIQSLQKKEEIRPLDFLSLSVKQVKILEELKKIGNMIEKIRNFGQIKAGQILRRNLEKYQNIISQESGKDFVLDLANFVDEDIPSEHLKEWTDIFAQLIRNSVAHGFESSEERRALGKPEKGTISIKTLTTKGGYEIIYRDDGRSFNLEKIKKRALDQKIVTEADLAKMKDGEIIELIFAPGFSTSEIADKNSGRGMGMDILRHIMNQLGGKIHIRWKRGEFTEFGFYVPFSVDKNERNESSSQRIAEEALGHRAFRESSATT